MKILLFVLKLFSWFCSWLIPINKSKVVILMYHRVTGDVNLELDVSFTNFEKQMHWLAKTGSVISLDEAVRRLIRNEMNGRTWYVITFDDAYCDFYDKVLPVVEKLFLPVTLYVTTNFIENPNRPPISRSVPNINLLKPITWSQLSEIASSPFVTIGGHTHTHREMTLLSDSEVHAEIMNCDLLLQSHIGKKIKHFAYPRGVWNQRVESLLSSYYDTIVLVGGGAVSSQAFNSKRIPRVPIQRSDGMLWFTARISGRLFFAEKVIRLIKYMRNFFLVF